MLALHSKESMVNVQNQDWRVLSTAEIVNLKFERLNSIGYLYLIFLMVLTVGIKLQAVVYAQRL